MVVRKKFWEANSKIRLLEDFCNLVGSIWVKFQGCAAKTVGGVGFLTVTGFSKKALLLNCASWLNGTTFKLANARGKLAIVVFEKNCYAKNATPPTVFAAHSSDLHKHSQL